jgi:type 1 glutamine amidotransferase
MRTLVMCDDLWHPGEMIRHGFASLGDCGFDFEFLEDGADWSAAHMAEFPLVVLAKSNVISATNKNPWLTVEAQHEFQHYLHAGHGLVVLHSGTAGYKERPVMRVLTGGMFLHHPDQCPVSMIPKTDCPVTSGAVSFTVQDEHYFMALDDPQAEVFLQSRSTHGIQPAGWARSEGRGRVCVLTPGHHAEVWRHPMFQILLRNALHWAAGNNSTKR